MNTKTWIIIGEPKAQPRPKAFAFKGRARVYDAGTAEHWKQCIAMAVTEDPIERVLDQKVGVSMDFYFKRPKSHYTAKGVLKESAGRHYEQKPDIDNLAKAVLDALTSIQIVWRDDSLVSPLFVDKHWSPNGVSSMYLTLKWGFNK